MSKKPITYVHYFPGDQTAIFNRSLISDHEEDKRTYRNVSPASASQLRKVLRGLILEGGCDVLLPTGYTPYTINTFFDWAVFTPAWDPGG